MDQLYMCDGCAPTFAEFGPWGRHPLESFPLQRHRVTRTTWPSGPWQISTCEGNSTHLQKTACYIKDITDLLSLSLPLALSL